jgi:hypothetical protein
MLSEEAGMCSVRTGFDVTGVPLSTERYPREVHFLAHARFYFVCEDVV